MVLQLRWGHQFQFAGYYAAQWQGYYEEAGLDVEIRSALAENAPPMCATTEVAEGRADFGIGGADILVAMDGGQPLTVVASVVPTSFAAFYALPESGIQTPRDFVGKRVMRRPGDLIDVELQAVLRHEGLTRGITQPVESQARDLSDLWEDRVEVVLGYRVTTPFLARSRGIELVEIRPEAYGVDFYGDSLFTRTEMVRQNPGLVHRFRSASLRGWEYALRHPEEIIQRIVNDLPAHYSDLDSLAFNRFQAEVLTNSLHSNSVPLGHINPMRWEWMQQELAEYGLVSASELPPQAIYTHDDESAWTILRWRKTALVLGVLCAALATLVVVYYIRALRRKVELQQLDAARSAGKFELALAAARQAAFEWDPQTDQLNWALGSADMLADAGSVWTAANNLAAAAVCDNGGRCLQTALNKVASGKVNYQECECQLEGTDGRKWVLICCGALPRSANERLSRVFGVVVDISSRKRAEDELRKQANEDPLTGLLNRRALKVALKTSAENGMPGQAEFVLAIVDLDGFKPVNDEFGHGIGDEVLRVIAHRLSRVPYDGKVVARLGGDEFAVLLRCTDDHHVRRWAEATCAAIAEPIALGSTSVSITACIGWARYPDDASDVSALFKLADEALYHAKSLGHGQISRHREDGKTGRPPLQALASD